MGTSYFLKVIAAEKITRNFEFLFRHDRGRILGKEGKNLPD